MERLAFGDGMHSDLGLYKEVSLLAPNPLEPIGMMGVGGPPWLKIFLFSVSP